MGDLWQQLLWAASHRQQIDNVPDCKVITPDGDIVRSKKVFS